MDEQVQSDLQEQFDTLTAQKVALWDQIKGISDDYEREQTPEWSQIRELDAELLKLRAQIEGGR